MARIPDDVIERLKQEVSLQRLAEAQGIELKKHGQDLLGLCPFHDDKEPSLVITPKKNLWHCLGACQAGGSVIDWVMKLEGVSFRHAVELLQNDYCPALDAKPVKRTTVPKLSAPIETDIADQQLLNQVIDYYHETLKQTPDALAFLEKRGIADAEAIDHFKLGFSNRSLGYRLPKANRKGGAAIRGQLQNLGLYRGSGHEHFSGSLVIPVMDEHGNVQEVYGRKILSTLRKGTPKHLYLPGPHHGVFNIEAFKASKEIILCESLIDALTFWCNGYRNVTTSYGIEGFTKEHLAAFKQHEVDRVLIAYDRDEAGEGAATKLSKQLMKEGIDCYRINFPKGMDANEYALQVTPASKSLGVVIRSAVWLGKGKGKAQPIITQSKHTDATKGNNSKEEIESTSIVAELEEVVHDVLPASPIPEPPKSDSKADVSGSDITMTMDGEPRHPDSDPHKAIPGQNRQYRIRGMDKNLGHMALKVNIRVIQGDAWHMDTLDLNQQRSRTSFIKQASIELGVSEEVIKADLGKVLQKCESLQEENIKAAQQPKPSTFQLTENEYKEALKLLKSKHLLSRIRKDFNQCGIVGESTNMLVGYLASISRKLDNPLAVIIQSTSAAGKSALMDAVLRFIPEEDRSQYSAMTGQSLFYMGETDLKHKVLAIVEEEGASQATYALKLLQSEGQLTIASTTKDPDTGELVTKPYYVEGPVMLFLTTTAIEVDEELMNRCLVLTVNEDREQTQAIHALQRKKRTLAGLLQKTEREALLKVHQNAQRLLKFLAVVNPYAEQLTFLNDQTRTRRDHEKYLTLIDSIALLHQYQRPIKTINHHGKPLQYVEVTLDDIEMVNDLAHEVLGRTLDELPPQTRKLLMLLDKRVTEACQRQALARSDYRFSRRDIRAYSRWSDTALKVHLARLVDMEYVIAYRGGRGSAFSYELLYDGQGKEGEVFLPGLIDTETLKQHYDANRSGQKGKRSGAGQPLVRGQSGVGQGCGIDRKAKHNKASSHIDKDNEEKPYKRGNGKEQSYNQIPSLAASAK